MKLHPLVASEMQEKTHVVVDLKKKKNLQLLLGWAVNLWWSVPLSSGCWHWFGGCRHVIYGCHALIWRSRGAAFLSGAVRSTISKRLPWSKSCAWWGVSCLFLAVLSKNCGFLGMSVVWRIFGVVRCSEDILSMELLVCVLGVDMWVLCDVWWSCFGIGGLVCSCGCRKATSKQFPSFGGCGRRRRAVRNAELLQWPELPGCIEIRPCDLRWSLGDWKEKKIKNKKINQL